jgi:hypothetical protein
VRLRAKVRRVTGNTRHLVAGAEASSLIAWVELEPDDGGYFLLYLDASGQSLTDTWHETVEAAREQARFEFEIDDDDWFVP